MPGCNVQYQEFMIVCIYVLAIVHFIIIAIACWQVNLVHLALSKLTEWYNILFDQ